MNEPAPSTASRDELLRRVGRNVVNFQRLEATIRSLMPALEGSGTLVELQTHHARIKRTFKKASLGDLAAALHGRLYSDPPPAAPAQPPTEVRLSYSIRLEATESEALDHKRMVLKLVAERNRLIHKDLLSLNFDSADDCARMSKQLDEQNERVCAQLAQLMSLREASREAFLELQGYFESEEFLAELRRQQNDA